jgi:hypothetical protein
VVIWLNGPFGVGKTTVARILASSWPGAGLVDPERLGWLLRRTIGLGRADYQTLRSWRRGTVWLVARAARRHRTVIVPMSVLHPPYVREMLAELPAARPILLDAGEETVRARALSDVEDLPARAWRMAQIERYAVARAELAEVPGTVVIDTDRLTPADVAARVRAAV